MADKDDKGKDAADAAAAPAAAPTPESANGTSATEAAAPAKKGGGANAWFSRALGKKKDAAAGGWNSGFLNAEPKKKKASAGGTTVTTNTADEPGRQRKVAFGADEVKEIPRIGNTSIKAAQQMQKLQQQQPVAMPQEEQHESEPISREVFSGVVKERSAIGTTSTSTSTSVMTPEQPEQQQQPPPQRKLSRFAQQRLEQRGGL